MKTALPLLVALASACLWAGPKTVGSHGLFDTQVIRPGAERNISGVGVLRELRLPSDVVGMIDEGGTRIHVLRISTGGTEAARLYIRNMALGVGMKLYVYGRNGDGSMTRFYGPFERVGPLESGEFWTDAIPGSEIVVELQTGPESPASLPFEIVGLAAASLAEVREPAEPDASDVAVQTSMYRGQSLTHAVKGEWAVFEGDIVLGRTDELTPAMAVSSRKGRRDAVAITGSSYRWPGGVIPYTIDPTLPTPSRVTGAIDHWNSTMATHVMLVPRTNETAYVYFVRSSTASTCSSYVGRTGSQQNIQVGDYCSMGNMIHEIGHAVGLWHEQSREDRDGFVKILWENITSGSSYNFNQNISNGDDIGAYNYDSVMHYAAYAFSSNGLPTVETIPAGIPIGQRGALSAGDIAAVRLLYPLTSTPPKTSTPISVTISSNPSGMPIVIDGITMTAPVTMEWMSGSAHTVSALDPAITTGTRILFSKWSDGGSATHEITTPTEATTIRADYTTSYLLVTSATPVGTVANSPASADSFYTAGTPVVLNATGPASYCFVSWTGLTLGTPSQTTLTMTRAFSVEANFQPGGYTISPTAVASGRNGGTYTVNVSASSGCLWSASSSASWVRITSGATGSGPGVVTLSVESKKGGNRRSAVVTIAGQSVTIAQQ